MNVENDDYLWDRSGTPDPDVERLERKLASLAQQKSSAAFGCCWKAGSGRSVHFGRLAALATAAAHR